MAFIYAGPTTPALSDPDLKRKTLGQFPLDRHRRRHRSSPARHMRPATRPHILVTFAAMRARQRDENFQPLIERPIADNLPIGVTVGGVMPARCKLALFAAPMIGLALLSACSQPPGTIFRERALPGGGQLDLNDSRVRAITTHAPDISTKPGVVVPAAIVCVEPPPSVALALANGLGVGISVLQYGSGALSNAVSENVFQTEERTIAIQALLNAGYQNCLDYSNGAITNTFYAIRASNLDNLLVTMALASEAAGNLRSNLGSASTQAAAEAEASQSFLANSVEDIQGSAKALGDARRNTTAKRETLVKNEQAANEADEKHKKAVKKREDALAADPQANTATIDSEIATAQQEKTTADKAVETAEADLKEAEQQQDDLENAMLNKIDATTSAKAGGKEVKGAGGPSGRPTDTAVLTIGEMQRRFLERSTSGQYITACLVELGLSSADPSNFGSATKSGPSKTFERELWEEGGKQYMKDQLEGEHAGIGPDEAAVFTLFARSERNSMMTQLCGKVLEDTVMKSQQNEQEVAMARVKTERLQVAAHLLEVRAEIGQQCEAITGTTEADNKRRESCHKRLEGIDLFIQRELSDRPSPMPIGQL